MVVNTFYGIENKVLLKIVVVNDGIQGVKERENKKIYTTILVPFNVDNVIKLKKNIIEN